MEDKIHNIVIIGGGPAGLSAAIYNSRANLNPFVFAGSPPGGQLMLTSEVENFPGYKHILGPDLIEVLREQAKGYGTEIINENITSVDFSKLPLELGYTKGIIKTHTVIIATGAQAMWLGLESEQKFRGKGVSACATCDGFFFKDKVVAIVGGGDTAMEEAQTLTKFAKKLYIIHRRDSFRASKIMQERILSNKKIEVIWNNQVEEVIGKIKVEGLRLKNEYKGSVSLPVDGLFLAIGHKPDTMLFQKALELDSKGYILTSAKKAMEIALKGEKVLESPFDFHFQSMTSKAGVFAGGDCVDHIYKQASTAAGLGVAAALDAERWLFEKNI